MKTDYQLPECCRTSMSADEESKSKVCDERRWDLTEGHAYTPIKRGQVFGRT
jgi:hypothetical protein